VYGKLISLGDYDKAAELFTQAMALLEQGSFGTKLAYAPFSY
jgi:hypothetical protein